MDPFHDATTLIQALQGTPLTILFAMLILRRPLGVTELARLTGYHQQTVRKGLQQLKFLNLVTQTQRYFGWQLTDKGYQLPLIGLEALSLPDSSEGEKITLPAESTLSLPDSTERDNFTLNVKGESQDSLEREKIALPSRSSSLTTEVDSEEDVVFKTTTTTDGESENFTLEGEKITLDNADRLAIINMLTERCSSPPQNAARAARIALERGENLADVQTEILRWLAYCLTKRGKTINNPGIFIPTRIEQGVYAPDWFKANGEIGEEIRQLRPPPCYYCGQPTTETGLGEPVCTQCKTQTTGHGV